MKTASARLDDARISLKHSIALCKELRGKRLDKAKSFLENMINNKTSIEGKHYTNASKKILEILKNAEANAASKGMNIEKTFVNSIKADQSFKFVKPKSRYRMRGRKAKIAKISVVLGER